MTHSPPPAAASDENARLAALFQVSHALGTSLNLNETLRIVMDAAIRLTGAERGFLMLFDEAGELVFRIARSAAGEPLDESQFEVSHGVLREVAQSGTPVVTTDARQDPRFSAQDSVVQYALRSILAVPLKVRGQITGVLYVDNKARRGLFSHDDLDLLNTFAGQAAVALDNARLYTQTDQALAARVAELQTMHTIDRHLNAGLTLDHVLGVTLDWAIRRSLASTGWIGLVDDPPAAHERRVRPVAGRDGAPADPLPADHPRLRTALATGQTQAFAPEGGAPAALVAPLVRENRVVAVIVVERPAHAFTGASAEFLARLADHAAMALENARLYDAVRQANDAKTEFIRTVTHELKIPMTSIKGYTDLLKMVGPLSEQQEQFVATIRSNVDRMAALVSDLSDISRLESGRINLEPRALNLAGVVAEAVANLRAGLEAKQQTVSADLPPGLPPVEADEARLLQVLGNLLSNAHKYSPPGSAITLSAEVEDGRVRVAVADQGVGISPADQARLFTQFFRSDDPQVREQNGWGLGLHVARRLVELMRGEVSVRSTLGLGSTFSFTVPVAPQA